MWNIGYFTDFRWWWCTPLPHNCKWANGPWSPLRVTMKMFWLTMGRPHNSFALLKNHKTKTFEEIWATARQNQQNVLCAQQRFRSSWASAQSDQSLRCPHEETLGPWLPCECTAKTDQTGQCPGWSESSLDAQVILLVLPCCGLFSF